MKFALEFSVSFVRIKMPPFAVVTFVANHQIALPENVVAVLVNSTAMPTGFAVVK